MKTNPFDRCFEIAAFNRSPLFQASRLLSPGKRRLFLASYAAMRLVDDLVDEQFITQPDPEGTLAVSVHAQVECWRRQACEAANGTFQPTQASYEPQVFEALNLTVGCSNLSEWPWNALAVSMRADIDGRPMETWGDFLTYSEGATVAPATVFVYILASVSFENVFKTPEPLIFYREKVRDMAIFCYVIHILRDLACDVVRSKRLVTIPEEMLTAAGLDKELLGQWITQDPQRIKPLKRLLLDQARGCRERGMGKLMKDIPLPTLEKLILKKLVGHYTHLHDGMELEIA